MVCGSLKKRNCPTLPVLETDSLPGRVGASKKKKIHFPFIWEQGQNPHLVLLQSSGGTADLSIPVLGKQL